MTTPTLRRYQEIWERLKQRGEVRIQLNMPVRRMRKGVQKEKYLDEKFRLRYPNSELTSCVSMEGDAKIVQFKLQLNDVLGTDDFEFRCATCKDTGIVDDMACPVCTTSTFAKDL